jgi:hypothetical protein
LSPGTESDAFAVGVEGRLAGFGGHQRPIAAVGLGGIDVIRAALGIEDREDDPAL